MRLATLKTGEVVAVDQGRVSSVQEGSRTFAGTMLDLIQNSAKLQIAREPTRPAELTDFGAPLQTPSKIVAIGLNYLDHATETELALPETPLVFAKFPNALTGPADPIVIPTTLTKQVDYEVELAVIIGRRAKNVSKVRALEYVFGYTVLNDISARDLQFGDKQWVRGKSLDSFCPTGPVIVTADEIPNPQTLELGCSVNEQSLQHATTRDMIFGVADLIEHLSYAFTLEPGDIIASGTPSGVGFTRQPPVYLRPGDVVRTWIGGIGELINPVVAA